MDERRRAGDLRSIRGPTLRRALAGALLAVFGTVSDVVEVAGQETDGSVSGTLGGAALGIYSGGFFGVVGGLLPCDRTLHGRACVAISGGAGGVAGLIAGGIIGSEEEEAIRARWRGAGYGLLIGSAVGIVLQQAVRQYAWNDALLVGAFGAAVGAAPGGTLVGSGVGALVGGAAWALSPRGGVQDLIMFTLVGSMVGGLYDWVDGAADARRPREPRVTSMFSIEVG